jgi:FkbM family methyltransferase
MNEFQDRVYVRDQEVDGVSGWHWLKGDDGAWQGPMEDWAEFKEKVLPKVTSRGVVVQAGGNLGMYPRLWSKYFDTVYTFEPCGINFYILTLNCQSDRIFKFNAALGDKHGLVDLKRAPPCNVGMHQIAENHDGTGRVPMLRVDDLALPECGLIQLDCEGVEGMVLLGAFETLLRCRPIVTVETCDDVVERQLAMAGYNKALDLRYDKVFVPVC